MNNYEQSRVVDLGPASNVIRGAKLCIEFWVDTFLMINYLDLWLGDIDETDE